tara:strand:- start:3391 stop:4368 length:978 start_codon:yes stop_codon:yes gene_type:complete
MINLSIIIPVYNAEKYISNCITSCLNQDYENYEIILVDDGSTDNSLMIMADFEQSNDNITLITQKNQRQGAARNNGLKIAKGEYIWFVDADDLIAHNSITSLIKVVLKTNLDMVRFDAANCTSFGDIPKKRLCEHEIDKLYLGHEVILENKFSVCVPFYIFKNKFLRDNNLYFLENMFYEDIEFMMRAFDKVKLFRYFNETFYIVNLIPESSTRSKDLVRKHDYIKVIKSHISYLNKSNLNSDVKIVFYKNIGMCMNNMLFGTLSSKLIFNDGIVKLNKINNLDACFKYSKSYLYSLQFYLTKYPKILRLIMLLHRKLKTNINGL